ncbi:hypothetical protein VFPBJ_05460 [Purpureocillium lilacinum]|uniref:Uncharacterized protein n=1 Tax=Purpureocillium lilacinum TaxID=33203 RepID=A0A179GPP8_PURLI|nr:hypothetical protein VFPBJ_05460 [Purpureocillium lilacinum]
MAWRARHGSAPKPSIHPSIHPPVHPKPPASWGAARVAFLRAPSGSPSSQSPGPSKAWQRPSCSIGKCLQR